MELYGVFWERKLLPEEEQALCSLLPPHQRRRTEQFRDMARRQEHLVAYSLLALALRERRGISTLPAIAAGKKGKPCFPDHPEIFFSISHTKGGTLVGLDDGPIGVDVEHLRPIGKRTMERLGKGMTEEEFLRIWVRREARAKRSGVGLSEAIRSEPPMVGGEQYRELRVPEGFFAGVSFGGEERDAVLFCRKIEDLLP